MVLRATHIDLRADGRTRAVLTAANVATLGLAAARLRITPQIPLCPAVGISTSTRLSVPIPYPGHPAYPGYPGNAVDPQAPFWTRSRHGGTAVGQVRHDGRFAATVPWFVRHRPLLYRLDSDRRCAVVSGSRRNQLQLALLLRLSGFARRHHLGDRRRDHDVHRQRQGQLRPQAALVSTIASAQSPYGGLRCRFCL